MMGGLVCDKCLLLLLRGKLRTISALRSSMEKDYGILNYCTNILPVQISTHNHCARH